MNVSLVMMIRYVVLKMIVPIVHKLLFLILQFWQINALKLMMKIDSGSEVEVKMLLLKLLLLLMLLLKLMMLLILLLILLMKPKVTMLKKPKVTMMKKPKVTMMKKPKVMMKKKKKKNFTDSSQKLKETGLTICLRMKNKMMDYSIVTLSLHSNMLIIWVHLVLMIKQRTVEMKLMT
jgi:hypothetical protein